jgi:hypothetical protein
MVQKGMKFGLIAGGVGAVVNIMVSAVLGICGPFVAMLAGAAAGFFTVRGNTMSIQKEGAKLGATSGAIAGAVVLIGQIIGGIIALNIILASGTDVPFGTLPDASNSAEQVGFWVGGLGAGLCFGLVGIGMGAAGGALAGYFATQEQSAELPPQM